MISLKGYGSRKSSDDSPFHVTKSKITARTTQGWPSKVLLWLCYTTHILSTTENKHISFKLCVVFPEEHIKQILSHTFTPMVSRPLCTQTCSNFHTRTFKGISFTWISKTNKNFQKFWETIVTNILFLPSESVITKHKTIFNYHYIFTKGHLNKG